MTPLQAALPVVETPTQAVGMVAGLAALGGALAALAALGYRWYARERVPTFLSLLVGLSGVALYLNTTTALGQVLGGEAAPLSAAAALFNGAAFLAAGAATALGRRLGDRIGTDLLAVTGTRDLEGEVSRVVAAVGRVIAVEVPDDVGDVVGYDPVADDLKEKIAGRTFLFPRRLTVAELEARLTARLETDYGVGHVDVDLGPAGEVRHLALGRRAAGIGPSLLPETVAVAVHADPAFAARPGDRVQVRAPETGERLTTGELRGVRDDAVTLAVDAEDAAQLDDATEYRLVTLPTESQPHREFVSLLRAAPETLGVVELAPDAPLVGESVGTAGAAVVALRPADDGALVPLPALDRPLRAGDALYLLARPEDLRRVQAAASSSGEVREGDAADTDAGAAPSEG